MNNKIRNIIIHAHIFKNAGSTIDWVLQNNFGNKFIDDRNDKLVRADCGNYLKNLLTKNKKIEAISSHSMPLPMCKIEGFKFHTITLLRHPLLRVRSVYDFEHKQEGETPGALHAKKYNFQNYIRWRMRAEVAPTIRNMQVRYLTHNSLPQKEELTEFHLESACQFVSNNPLVGLVERFDDCIKLFKLELEPHFKNFDDSFEIQNITQKKKSTVEEKIKSLKEELGNELFNELLEKNELDLQLYRKSTEIINNRIALSCES